MNRYQHQDEVIKELWAVKDSTAETYSTVGKYLSHLREATLPKRKIPAASKRGALFGRAKSTTARRKATK